MSYDLRFYKKKGQDFSNKLFEGFLVENSFENNPAQKEFFYHNKNTGVYYAIECGEQELPKDIKNIDAYDYTYYLFNINFLRPDFFGKEAFPFVDKLIEKFDLYVIDYTPPQEYEIFKPKIGELYLKWSKYNKDFAKREEFSSSLLYCPLEQTTQHWEYNFNVNQWQEELGNNYFVPSIFYFKKKDTGQLYTVTTWTHHIPTVLPKVDYLILNKRVRKFFGEKNETIVTSYKNLMDKMETYFENYKDMGGKIIRPENSNKVDKLFNSLNEEEKLDSFEMIPVEKVTNTVF